MAKPTQKKSKGKPSAAADKVEKAADAIEKTAKETKDIVTQRQSVVTYICWALLAAVFVYSLFMQRWNTAFLSLIVFILTFMPFFFQSVARISLPIGFVGAIIFFMVGTLFLGEVFDFYERFWWWDIFMHTFSAVGFGIIGMLIVLFLVRGDRVAQSPPSMLVIMAFSFAVSVGAMWEIFEFGMDQMFGLNMQKSGLVDTMGDLIVDVIGAAIGAMGGYVFIKSRRRSGNILSNTINKVIENNPEYFND